MVSRSTEHQRYYEKALYILPNSKDYIKNQGKSKILICNRVNAKMSR